MYGGVQTKPEKDEENIAHFYSLFWKNSRIFVDKLILVIFKQWKEAIIIW